MSCHAGLTLARLAYILHAEQFALTSRLIICRPPAKHSEPGLTHLQYKPFYHPSIAAQVTDSICTLPTNPASLPEH